MRPCVVKLPDGQRVNVMNVVSYHREGRHVHINTLCDKVLYSPTGGTFESRVVRCEAVIRQLDDALVVYSAEQAEVEIRT